jgi:hypothetical protein
MATCRIGFCVAALTTAGAMPWFTTMWELEL